MSLAPLGGFLTRLNDPHRGLNPGPTELECVCAAEEAYHPAHTKPVNIAQPSRGRHSLEACEGVGNRPVGLARLSQALARAPGTP